MTEQKIEQLDQQDQQVLEAASAAGIEFSAETVATVTGASVEEVETRCSALERKGQFLRSTGIAEWEDGTVAARYKFLHALFQEVLYRRVSASRQIRLHKQIGARLETGYGRNARQRASELAVHFFRGRNALKALEYLQLAAEQDLQKNAHQEAIAHLTTALDLIEGLSGFS